MSRKFLLIDINHMLHRARHVTKGDIWTQSGLALHIVFESIKVCWNKFNADHVVFCLDGKSWRHSLYEPYKKNRQYQQNLKKAQEIEDDKVFYEIVDDFLQFVNEKTNCTVLKNEIAEADDLIARFINLHPNDEHIIISGDTDFIQLLSDNVKIYDGINKRTLTKEGIFNEKDQKMEFQVKNDGKLKILKENDSFEPNQDWISWALFVKIIRGDSSDNIFSAFPKVRIDKIKKAFNDRFDQGYEWNNFMLSRWTDHNQEDQRVKDCYEQNKELIDLTAQPDEVKEFIDDYILNELQNKEKKKQIGFHFLKFAGKYELIKISERKEQFLDFLNAEYK